MALQALSAGPILALNLKPFNETAGEDNLGTKEQVKYISFDPCDFVNSGIEPSNIDVLNLFDRDRFWKIDADQLPYKLASTKYINIAATDTKELSCSLFFRKCNPASIKQYNTTFREWYKNAGETVPEYLEDYIDKNIQDYFAEIFVFRGEFTEALCGTSGILGKYFTVSGEDTVDIVLNTQYQNNFGDTVDALSALANDENSNLVGIYRGILLPNFKDQLGSYISLDILFNKDKDVHKMIMKLDESLLEDMLIKDEDGHNKIAHWPNATNGGWENVALEINGALKPMYLSGYTYGTIHKGHSATETCAKSLNVLKDKGIRTALTNHVDSEYHYIIDTYAGLVQTNPTDISNFKAAKFNICIVAKEKFNCLAIMNAPAKSDLLKINSFNLDDFGKGNYSAKFALPTEVEGASHCAYYTPLVFGDNSIKSIVPSAAIVSNNFMEKWKSRQPYYIVAGPNYGRMEYNGLIGPDYNYSREDLDVYETMGINCMVYVPRKGTYINSNQTAKQKPITALSKVHVRELVTYVQDEIEKMMQNYQWELNTQTLRDTIKTKADAILEKIKANGGVYDYLNVCDGSNNTPEVIDNEMIILDTSIEPARGAGKMIQRLTIHKTGGISSLIN
jgi:hypothetical protein